MIELEPKFDERGFFARSFCVKELADAGIDFNVAQMNRTFTKNKGAVRGMHLQTKPKAEDKIVQCLRGAMFDVAIDLRRDSATYGQWISEELTGENEKMFFIPKGMAHGFQALTDDCETQYLMSEFHYPEYAKGFRWNDSFFNIRWPLAITVISEKDKNWPLVAEI